MHRVMNIQRRFRFISKQKTTLNLFQPHQNFRKLGRRCSFHNLIADRFVCWKLDDRELASGDIVLAQMFFKVPEVVERT